MKTWTAAIILLGNKFKELGLGGGVKGGKVHGKWPGLSSQHLYENRDLAITTDFRDVFSELLTKQLAVPSLKSVFPGYAPKPLGVLA